VKDYTVKNIPDDLYHRTVTAAESGFRSLNQEILFRLKRSFDAEDARLTALHARWVAEALESGPAAPLNWAEFDAAIDRGKARARTRKAMAAA
jgi:hypothetical protein